MKNKVFWKNRSVFVTGGTGFLGSWLVQELVQRHAEVTVLIRDWIPESNFILSGLKNKVHVVWGELQDYFLLERTLNEYQVDTIFHLGAQTIVGIANANPLSTFETNIKGTWNILEAARRTRWISRIIVASSDKAYGTQPKLPYTEKNSLSGAHPYDVSKSCADLIAFSYYNTYASPVCITRCGNFFGGGDLNFNRIVPGTIRAAIENKNPLIRSNGRLIRDYIYILDVVQAYLLLAEKMDNTRLFGEAFNFSNEMRMSVLEIVKLLLKLMNAGSLKPKILNSIKSEIPKQYLCSAKARNLLGWKPRYTLEEGLKETICWYREFFQRNAEANT